MRYTIGRPKKMTSETCANCGHEERYHSKLMKGCLFQNKVEDCKIPEEAKEEYLKLAITELAVCPCKKFQPAQKGHTIKELTEMGMPPAQNHSPQDSVDKDGVSPSISKVVNSPEGTQNQGCGKEFVSEGYDIPNICGVDIGPEFCPHCQKGQPEFDLSKKIFIGFKKTGGIDLIPAEDVKIFIKKFGKEIQNTLDNPLEAETFKVLIRLQKKFNKLAGAELSGGLGE